MGPTGDSARVVQVHPTRRCNLRCLHCYSESGPHARGELPFDALARLVADAAGEGYTVLSLSGGEPLLYSRIGDLLVAGRAAGLATTLVTNGTLLDGRRADLLAAHADLVAVSVDGARGTHDRMRGGAGLFDRTIARLAYLRAAAVPFGLICTLTRDVAAELPQLVELAADAGARILQLHPLEEVGRAAHTLPGGEGDDRDAALAWLDARALQRQAGDRLRVLVDLVDLVGARVNPAALLADPDACGVGHCGPAPPLGALLSPLVVEPDGAVVPLTFGFPRAWQLGVLDAEPLPAMAVRWRRHGHDALVAVAARVLTERMRDGALPVVNWYRAMSLAAADVHPPAASG